MGWEERERGFCEKERAKLKYFDVQFGPTASTGAWEAAKCKVSHLLRTSEAKVRLKPRVGQLLRQVGQHQTPAELMDHQCTLVRVERLVRAHE